MNQESEISNIEQDLIKLDRDTVKTDETLVRLTRWIIILTGVMIFIGIVQLVVMWPKRTYCFNIKNNIQICEPDYFPYDSNPADAAYKLDQQLGS
jgi:hypothetical protein